jgi:hypothetical protein
VWVRMRTRLWLQRECPGPRKGGPLAGLHL